MGILGIVRVAMRLEVVNLCMMRLPPFLVCMHSMHCIELCR